MSMKFGNGLYIYYWVYSGRNILNVTRATKSIYIAFGKNTFCNCLERKTCLEKDPRKQNFGFWTGSLKSLALSPASNASCSQTAEKFSINLNINGIKWISQKTKRPLWARNGCDAFSLYASCLNNVLNNVFLKPLVFIYDTRITPCR